MIKLKFYVSCLTLFVFRFSPIHGETVKLQINHWNDINSQLERFEPLEDVDSVPKGGCVINYPFGHVCQGGVANLLSIEKNHYIREKNFLRLTPGNLVGGDSGWLSIVGWGKFGRMIRDHYQLHAMSLGIKDFGAGIARTWEYLSQRIGDWDPEIRIPLRAVLSNIRNCANFTTYETTEHLICNQIDSQVTLDVETNSGETIKIGVVGFINPDVTKLASTGLLEFDDINAALRAPINLLKAQGVKFIIALGDGSLAIAKSIIDSIPEVKLVIHGNGIGSSKNMKDNYPEKYGRSYIATAGKYGATMGKLVVEFESTTGAIKNVGESQLVSIDENIPENTSVASTITHFKVEVLKQEQDQLGRTHVTIHGGKVCRTNECNLGNIMADASVHCVYGDNSLKDKLPDGPILGIWHAGAFFNDIVRRKSDISAFDVHKWLPLHNNVNLVRINGSALKTLFEYSATALDLNSAREPAWGQFLQISNGMEVTYSINGGRGSVERIRVLKERADNIPKMADIEDGENYFLALPSFIREGGLIFDFVKKGFFENIVEAPLGYFSVGFDDECLVSYIRGLNGVSTGFEDRIVFKIRNNTSTSAPPLPTPNSPTPSYKNNTAKHIQCVFLPLLMILAGIMF